MIKLPGLKKINTVVFISGTGTNFKNLINFSLKKNSPQLILKLSYQIDIMLKALIMQKNIK